VIAPIASIIRVRERYLRTRVAGRQYVDASKLDLVGRMEGRLVHHDVRPVQNAAGPLNEWYDA
jgi:hypothetical protein